MGGCGTNLLRKFVMREFCTVVYVILVDEAPFIEVTFRITSADTALWQGLLQKK